MKDAATRPERVAVYCFALARTLLCGYRAIAQSITVDEATTYLSYVREHWANVWSNYDPNNHVLYSVLAQLSVRAFHPGEFTLRLPSVLAGFFFVIGLHRVLAAAVESAVVRWIALVGMSLAPLMLDFAVAARGYGLGLALLIWAIYFSMSRRDLAAGIFAGLSMAATFNLAFSVLGLIAFPLIRDKGGIAERMMRSLGVLLAASAIFLAICFPILRQVRTAQLYVGEPTIHAALYNLAFLTIRAVPGHPGLFGTGAGAWAIQYAFLPALTIFIAIVTVRSRRALLPASTLLLALIAIVASHFVMGLNYPVDRLGLHLFVLLGLAWAIAVASVSNRWIRAVNGGIAALFIAQFITQLHTRYFTLWEFDSATKQVAQHLRDETRAAASNSISVSASWFHTPALEFYRRVWRISALKPIERHEHTIFEGFDYYVLNVKEDDDLKAAGIPADLTPIFSDEFSGVLLATRR